MILVSIVIYFINKNNNYIHENKMHIHNNQKWNCPAKIEKSRSNPFKMKLSSALTSNISYLIFCFSRMNKLMRNTMEVSHISPIE